MKIAIFLMLGMATSVPTAAQVPELGQLFTSKAERAEIDARRDGADINADVAPPPAQADPLALNGIVQRGHGRSTVWLNQVARQAADQALVTGPAHQPGLAVRDRRLILRPGQSYDQQSGTVRDVKDGR